MNFLIVGSIRRFDSSKDEDGDWIRGLMDSAFGKCIPLKAFMTLFLPSYWFYSFSVLDENAADDTIAGK